jgi:CRISPR-associated protein Csm4
MKLIKVKITPYSSFVTFPKGDIIFGHFAYHSFIQGEKMFENYTDEEPKIIFSDILPDGYFYKPTLPLKSFDVDDSEKKEFRKKSWIKIKNLQDGALHLARVCSFFKTEIKVRNSINRVSFTTNGEGFAPYSIEEISFLHQPVIYILYKEKYFDKATILERLNLIGKVGFGKKGSIGKGHFTAEIDESFKRFDEDEVESDYYLTLSPTVLNKQPYIDKAYYNTFNRFGKYHSRSTPFKKPLLMADSGAVVKLKEKRTWIGRGIDNGIVQQSLVQGYSIVVPFKFDGKGL